MVAQWVFTLTATVADLGTAEGLFQDSLHSDEPAVRTSYHYRQLMARLYEAERVVAGIDTEEVAGFLDERVAAGRPVEFLRAQFLPIESSVARSTFGYARHRTIHHAHVGSKELRATLSAAGGQNARILVDTQQERLVYEWPEAVISHVLAPDLDTSAGIDAFAARANLAQEILANFAALLQSVMHPYAERVGVNVDLLYHDIADA